MRLVVDTCALIDLYNGKCLDAIGKLGYELLIPDVMQLELKQPSWDELRRYGILTIPASFQDIANVYSLRSRFPQPSIYDLFCLVVAKNENLILITGDKFLRQAAESEGVIVHGILWLLDELVRSENLAPNEALYCLKEMLSAGSRLPIIEVHKRVRLWS
jgi:predicted nucleic acid-binding protein